MKKILIYLTLLILLTASVNAWATSMTSWNNRNCLNFTETQGLNWDNEPTYYTFPNITLATPRRIPRNNRHNNRIQHKNRRRNGNASMDTKRKKQLNRNTKTTHRNKRNKHRMDKTREEK